MSGIFSWFEDKEITTGFLSVEKVKEVLSNEIKKYLVDISSVKFFIYHNYLFWLLCVAGGLGLVVYLVSSFVIQAEGMSLLCVKARRIIEARKAVA